MILFLIVLFFLSLSLIWAASGEPLQKISQPTNEAKITSAIWANLEDMILTGHENGECKQFEVKVGQVVPV